MGFDNECIVNIQSLAGEYFCPVCRLLVYPNEALQSQCTHLYCKPCLTYVVGTTRACPYDGYLVTEPDSKPLLESNKALAETIGKIAVRCLYHRSGCQWQGPLSDCTTHCSSCAYGNSAVVCNRCAVQIVHRQVQEHAQTCSGVQPQATQPDGAQNTVVAAPVNGGQPQTTTQLGTTTSMAPQTGTIPTTGQDPNLQASLNPQANGVAVGAVLTPEQLYQQQYYQQYPGYDPYQQAYQNYYPYPQQPQVYSQPPKVPQQPIQTQTPVQAQAPPQNQGQGQPQTLQNVNPPYQIAQPPAQMMPQAQPPSQGYPYPYPQSQPQQMLQYPQPQPQVQQHPQMPLQPHLQAHPQQLQQTQSYPHSQQMNQSLNPNAQPQTQQQTQAVTGHHSYPQPQAHQQMQMGTQQRPNLQPQSGSIPQLPPQMHGQYPPQSHPPVPNQQFPPQSQRPLNPYAQQPGHPPMQPLQQLVPQQHMPHQQAFSGQVTGPVQNQLRPHGQHVQLPPPPPLHPQMHQQPQSYSSRPMMPSQEAQPQGFAHSLAGYPGQAQGRPPHLGANQHLPSQNHHLRTSNQLHRNESPSLKTAENEANGLASTSGFGIESVQSVKVVGKEDVKDTSSELHKAESGGKSFDTGATEQKDDTDVSQKEENLTSSDKSKEGGADTGVQADTSQGYAKPEENKFGQVLGNGSTQPTHAFLPVDQGRGPNLPMQNPLTHQQRPYGPGQPLNMIRPQGPGHLPQPGQPFNPHIEHAQHPPFGRPPSQFVPHERNFELQHSGDPRMPLGKPTGSFNSSGGFMGRPPLYGVEGQIGQQRPIGLASNDIFPDSQPRYLNGQAPGTQSQVSRTLDKEPFGMNYDTGSKLETGAVGAPRFLPPYYSGGVNEPGSRVPDDNTGRGNFANPRSDFLRPVTGFGPHRMDRFSSRSPGRENAGFPPRDFGDLPGFPRNRPGIGNFEGGESRSFDGGHRPFSHFSRDELEGPGFQGPRSLPGHVRLGDPTGFGAFPGPARRGDLAGPENFPPYRPFSSSYPPPGSLDPFDNSRKRLLPNNGWCRICKVDCEGVEGLELHSQTREHQDMAMDMVRSIKLQNSKKQKMSNDRSSLEEPSKRRGAGYEVHDNRR